MKHCFVPHVFKVLSLVILFIPYLFLGCGDHYLSEDDAVNSIALPSRSSGGTELSSSIHSSSSQNVNVLESSSVLQSSSSNPSSSSMHSITSSTIQMESSSSSAAPTISSSAMQAEIVFDTASSSSAQIAEPELGESEFIDASSSSQHVEVIQSSSSKHILPPLSSSRWINSSSSSSLRSSSSVPWSPSSSFNLPTPSSSSWSQILLDAAFDNSASTNPWNIYNTRTSGSISKVNNPPYGYDFIFKPGAMTESYELQLRQTNIRIRPGHRYWVSLGGNTMNGGSRVAEFGLQRTTIGYLGYFAELVSFTGTYKDHINSWYWDNCSYSDNNAQFYVNGGLSTTPFKVAWISLYEQNIDCP